MSTTLEIFVNNTNLDESYGTSGVLYTQIALGSDFLIFTNGSVVVADGQPIPSSFQLSSAGVLLNGSQQTIPHYLLADVGSNLLREIFLMGPGNYQHVMAFVFSGGTTSEPILEAWDDSTLSTINDVSLGAGTPSNSWFHGVQTTSGLPGVNWSGLPLAGSADGNYLQLNAGNGPLLSAGVLYCNLKVVVPSTQLTGGTEQPVLTVKFTTV